MSVLGSTLTYELRLEIEASDHDGYCSGAESDYLTMTKYIDVEVPHSYDMGAWDGRVWTGPVHCEPEDVVEAALLQAIPSDESGCYRSGYCDISSQSHQHGLGRHSFRVHIVLA